MHGPKRCQGAASEKYISTKLESCFHFSENIYYSSKLSNLKERCDLHFKENYKIIITSLF